MAIYRTSSTMGDTYSLECDKCGKSEGVFLMLSLLRAWAEKNGWTVAQNHDTQQWDCVCPECGGDDSQ